MSATTGFPVKSFPITDKISWPTHLPNNDWPTIWRDRGEPLPHNDKIADELKSLMAASKKAETKKYFNVMRVDDKIELFLIAPIAIHKVNVTSNSTHIKVELILSEEGEKIYKNLELPRIYTFDLKQTEEMGLVTHNSEYNVISLEIIQKEDKFITFDVNLGRDT